MPLDPASRRALEAVLVATTVIAAVADSSLTYVGLRWLDGREGSAMVVRMIDAFGLAGGMAIRALIVVALVTALWKLVTVPSLRLFGLVVVAIINVAMIGWNLAVMW